MLSSQRSYGFPFNPIKSPFFTELSKSTRMKGGFKRLVSSKKPYFELSEIANDSFRILSESSHEINIFGREIGRETIDAELLKEDVERHVNIVERSPEAYHNRYFIVNTETYFDYVIDQSNKQGKFIPERGSIIYQAVSNYAKTKLGISDFFGEKEADWLVLISDEHKKQGPPKSKRGQKLAFMYRLECNSFSNGNARQQALMSLVEMAIADIDRGENIEEAIGALWSVGIMQGCQSMFYVLYVMYTDRFTKERFPFLYFSFLEAGRSFIEEAGGVSGTLSFLLCKEVGDLIHGYSSDIGALHASLSELFSQKIAFYENAGVVEHSIEPIRKFALHLSVQLVDINPNLSEEIRDKISRVNVQMSTIPDINKLKVILASADLKSRRIAKELQAACLKWEGANKFKAQINDIEEQAKELAQAPLDNVQKITELAAVREEVYKKYTPLYEEHKDVIQRLAKELMAAFDEVITDIKALKDEERKDRSDEELLNIALSDIQDIEEKLQEVTRELVISNENNEKLKETLSFQKQECAKIPAFDGHADVADTLRLVFNNKAALGEIVGAVVSLQGGDIIISKDLMIQLQKQKGFLRQELLFKKLLTLTSREFIDTFEERGSQGCFDLFTKSELAFKESDRTNSQHSREFIIDGVSYNCEYHLRLGVNNTEQNMLRVYFTVSDGKVVIGNIVRHMPTGSQ
jgi:hypothetical protein